MVHTGNISNNDLLNLFEANLEQIIQAVNEAPLAILGLKRLTIHPSKPS